jgi:hypothetical protein
MLAEQYSDPTVWDWGVWRSISLQYCLDLRYLPNIFHLLIIFLYLNFFFTFQSRDLATQLDLNSHLIIICICFLFNFSIPYLGIYYLF